MESTHQPIYILKYILRGTYISPQGNGRTYSLIYERKDTRNCFVEFKEDFMDKDKPISYHEDIGLSVLIDKAVSEINNKYKDRYFANAVMGYLYHYNTYRRSEFRKLALRKDVLDRTPKISYDINHLVVGKRGKFSLCISTSQHTILRCIC